MSNLLKSVGMLCTVLGLGSFLVRLFGRDSWLFQWMGPSRNLVMGAATLCGVGLFALAYRLPAADDDEYEEDDDSSDEEDA